MRYSTPRKWRIPLACWATLMGLFLAESLGIRQGSSAQAVFAAATSDNRVEVIRVSANLVMVPVSVTDMEGHVVNNLDIQDFSIEEDGRPEGQ